jgi:hypothetical protein
MKLAITPIDPEKWRAFCDEDPVLAMGFVVVLSIVTVICLFQAR